jgi:hypothetical protein
MTRGTEAAFTEGDLGMAERLAFEIALAPDPRGALETFRASP